MDAEKSSMDPHTKSAEQQQTMSTSESREMTMAGSGRNSMTEKEKENVAEQQQEYLTGLKLATVFSGLLLAVFLFALDQTIVSTAQPRIVSQFDALDKIAWISSAYFLTQAGLMLTVGQILTITSTKRVFLAAIFIFELGSLICAVAKSIDVLIFGRAFAGAGAAGLFTGVLAIIAEVTRLEDRPLLFASFGGAFAVASIIGPLLGGAFTDHVSWRWCFYINLPFGAITVAVVLLWLRTPPGHTKKNVFGDIPLWKKWLQLDWIGTAMALGFVTCLVLALQWGGNSKPWNDGSVIATFVVSGVLLAAFVAWEYWLGERAMLPTPLLRRRTQVGAAWAAFFIFMCMLLGTYYIPLWYQAKGSSAAKSGVNIIAFMLAMVVSSAVAGGFINKTGHYWTWMFISPFFTAVGYGLLYTIHPDTPNGRILGFQILIGIGIGPAVNQTLLATQTEYAYEPHLIPQGTSIVTFWQIIGGLIGISVGSSIFGNKLATGLPILAPNLSPAQIADVRASVSDIFTLPHELQAGVIRAYSDALNQVFLIGVAAAALCSVCVLFMKNYNVLKRGGNVAGAMA